MSGQGLLVRHAVHLLPMLSNSLDPQELCSFALTCWFYHVLEENDPDPFWIAVLVIPPAPNVQYFQQLQS